MEVFDSNTNVSKYSEDARVLVILGRYIKKNGLRKGFDEAITDLNLGKCIKQGATIVRPHQISKMRELTQGLDTKMQYGLVQPRLEILYKLILKHNK